MFVSAENNGASALIANRGAASGWETFIFSQPVSGYWALTAVNNEYVAIQTANGNTLLANVPTNTLPDTTLFTIMTPTVTPPPTSINIATATTVKLYSKSAAAYVVVGTGSSLAASTASASLATTFNIAAVTGGYTLQNAATAQFTSADNNGASPLVANRGTAAGWETFAFIAQAGSTYSIQASNNGLLVAVQTSGQLQATVANSGTIPSSAFYFVVAA